MVNHLKLVFERHIISFVLHLGASTLHHCFVRGISSWRPRKKTTKQKMTLLTTSLRGVAPNIPAWPTPRNLQRNLASSGEYVLVHYYPKRPWYTLQLFVQPPSKRYQPLRFKLFEAISLRTCNEETTAIEIVTMSAEGRSNLNLLGNHENLLRMILLVWWQDNRSCSCVTTLLQEKLRNKLHYVTDPQHV